ncbi:MAG TPA: FliG C-terminal domain-containing protein [Urbifossiella sp.]|jgi:flagellar motor switch protein FliG|nr:FliG C-terminal domain-containing protein [Urbifossiella sp.]
MADGAAEDVVFTLLRALPAEVSDGLLTRLGGPEAARLRARLAAPAEPTPPAALDAALDQFFDLQRIADRPAPPAPGAAAPAPEQPPPTAADEVRGLPPDKLALALDGEPPAAAALVLSCLDPAGIGQVMRRLSPELRADLAVRLGRPGARNPELVERLAAAVAEKARRMAGQPPQPTTEERIEALADILRALARPDRTPILQRLEAADPELAAAVREKLYRIEDLLRVPDRQLQALLTEFDVKKLAQALKDVDPAVRAKVTANMSSRAKTVLGEESELLGSVSASVVKAARSDVLAVLRRLEDEGRITIEE